MQNFKLPNAESGSGNYVDEIYCGLVSWVNDQDNPTQEWELLDELHDFLNVWYQREQDGLA